MHTVHVGLHTAHLDVLTGEGLAVLPQCATDVFMGAESVLAADWHAFIAELDRLGWEPSDDGDGLPVVVGLDGSGREVIGLYGRDPIHAMPALEDMAAASAELLRLAGVVPD